MKKSELTKLIKECHTEILKEATENDISTIKDQYIEDLDNLVDTYNDRMAECNLEMTDTMFEQKLNQITSAINKAQEYIGMIH